MSDRRRGGSGLGVAKDVATALARLVVRRIGAEWRSTRLYSGGLNGPRPSGLAITPKDFRPFDPEVGRQILLGRMSLSNMTLEIAPGGDPWDVASPSRLFAVELHRFAWLPSLLAQEQAGQQEALRLVLDWERLFGRVTPFIWGAETLERRVFNLACGMRALTERASEVEAADLLGLLARQTRHLLKLDGGPHRRAERAAVAAVVATTLSGKAGQVLRKAAFAKLTPALAVAVMPDGGVKTRSPEQTLELLFDLLTLDDALLQRGRDARLVVSHSIDRLTEAVRFFTLGDGRLAAFQGGEAVEARRVAAAVAHHDGEGRVHTVLPHSGYHRLIGRTLLAVVDTAPPAEGAWSLTATAHPLALEITCGADRLIANTGWGADAQGPAAMRLTAGGTTASLGDGSAGRPLSGVLARGLGPRLADAARKVNVERQEVEAGVLLELSHDGWAGGFGLIHERRLYLDSEHDELRGEDRFEPVSTAGKASRRALTYAVRFHLPPDVQVSLARDKRSVLLRGASNRGWWFRNDAPDVMLESSIYFENHTARRAAQIVLKGPLTAASRVRVRWKLTPVEPTNSRAPTPAPR